MLFALLLSGGGEFRAESGYISAIRAPDQTPSLLTNQPPPIPPHPPEYSNRIVIIPPPTPHTYSLRYFSAKSTHTSLTTHTTTPYTTHTRYVRNDI